MVTPVWALATAPRALAAMATPDAVAAAFAASTRSKPATECPALTRFAAIGAPMLPRPMNAILDMGLQDLCKEALKRGSRRGQGEGIISLPTVNPAKSGGRNLCLTRPRSNKRFAWYENFDSASWGTSR